MLATRLAATAIGCRSAGWFAQLQRTHQIIKALVEEFVDLADHAAQHLIEAAHHSDKHSAGHWLIRSKGGGIDSGKKIVFGFPAF